MLSNQNNGLDSTDGITAYRAFDHFCDCLEAVANSQLNTGKEIQFDLLETLLLYKRKHPANLQCYFSKV